MVTRAAVRPQAQFPAKAKILFDKSARFIVLRGGRASGKSTSAAKSLLVQGAQEPLRIMCGREYQNSIAESIHQLLCDQISVLGLRGFYKPTNTDIEARNGTRFFFRGLHRNIDSLKSIEGIDVLLIEEGQTATKETLIKLIPTIRKPGSRIIVLYNQEFETDPIHQMFSGDRLPPRTLIAEMNWSDNPWLPPEANEERLRMLDVDPDLYDWVWEGKCRKNSAASIFRGKYVIEAFETPDDARFYHGADWGFSNDPTALVRCWIRDEDLMIDYEASGVGVDLEDTPALFDTVPTSRDWPIKADEARPETISFMRRRGFNISAAKKWKGCVEDGIEHLRSFRKIRIHPRCTRTAQEMRLYSYKVDKMGDPLPIIVSAFDHCIDAIRYSLDGYITSRGGVGVWERLVD